MDGLGSLVRCIGPQLGDLSHLLPAVDYLPFKDPKQEQAAYVGLGPSHRNISKSLFPEVECVNARS